MIFEILCCNEAPDFHWTKKKNTIELSPSIFPPIQTFHEFDLQTD